MDVRVENHGSVVLLRPLTDAATNWMEDHLPADAQRWGNAVVVEPRYAQPILDGMVADGLDLRGDA